MCSFGKTIREENIVSVAKESNGDVRLSKEKTGGEIVLNLPFMGMKQV